MDATGDQQLKRSLIVLELEPLEHDPILVGGPQTRELVGRHDQHAGTSTALNRRAQCALARAVVGDRSILGQRADQSRDLVAEYRHDLIGCDRGVLDNIVQYPRRDNSVAARECRQQVANRQGMLAILGPACQYVRPADEPLGAIDTVALGDRTKITSPEGSDHPPTIPASTYLSLGHDRFLSGCSSESQEIPVPIHSIARV